MDPKPHLECRLECAGDVTGGDQLDSRPDFADLGHDVVVPRTFEHDHGQLLWRQALGLCDSAEVPLDGHIEVDDPTGPAADHELLHVVHMSREHRPALGQGDHRDRTGETCRGQARAFDRIDGHVELGFEPVADLLAEIEHRRFVLLAFADDDGALHVDRRECTSDGLDGAPVGAHLVASALQRSGGQGPGLGHPEQLQGQVAVHLLVHLVGPPRHRAG